MFYDYEYFKREILKLTGVDLNSYKENQMKRRIDGLMQRRKMAGYEQYVLGLSKDKGLYEEFMNYITINVSEFYRDSKQWKVMEEQAIPELIGRFGRRLKIWSAACSTGDEPYSLVMALSRHCPGICHWLRLRFMPRIWIGRCWPRQRRAYTRREVLPQCPQTCRGVFSDGRERTTGLQMK